MDPKDVLGQASAIAHSARERVRAADLEASVRELERSDNRAMQSIARVYRMLQLPPHQ
jgi:hypothetical protein